MDGAEEAVASSSFAAPGPIRKRRFSSAKIQPTRVKRVMQSDEEIGRMVASVPVAIGRAMEHFAERFLEAASRAVHMGAARTLSPAHMKMAMLSNPHFHFLEPILRDIAVPGRLDGMGPPPPVTWTNIEPGVAVQHLPANMSIPGASLQGFSTGISNFALPQVPQSSVSAALSGDLNTVPVSMPQPVGRRRASNGASLKEEPHAGEKRKRGRPRKVKKTDKCVDEPDEDELHIAEDVSVAPPTDTLKESVDKDRELMPPPALPPRLANGRSQLKNGVGK